MKTFITTRLAIEVAALFVLMWLAHSVYPMIFSLWDQRAAGFAPGLRVFLEQLIGQWPL